MKGPALAYYAVGTTTLTLLCDFALRLVTQQCLSYASEHGECVHTQVLHDESGRMWLMLHSGSRNIGNVTAQYYDKIAQEQLAQQGIKVPGGLNYLEIASEHGQGYLQVSCLTFAPVMCWCASSRCASVKPCKTAPQCTPMSMTTDPALCLL